MCPVHLDVWPEVCSYQEAPGVPGVPKGQSLLRLSLSHCSLTLVLATFSAWITLGNSTPHPNLALLWPQPPLCTIRIVKDSRVLDKGDVSRVLNQAPATQEAKVVVGGRVPASAPAPGPSARPT